MIKADLNDKFHTTIILGTYNGESFIVEQINSILQQHRLPDEIIFSDDCSTDGTTKILDKYSIMFEKKNVKVKKVYRDKNVGYIANFLEALDYSTGDIVFFCDQDDIWKENKINDTINFFKANPRCIALHSNTEIIDSNGVIIKRNAQDYTKKKELLSIEKFIKKVNYPGMALAFKRIPICKKVNQLNFEVKTLPTHDWYICFLSCMLGGLYTTSDVYTLRRYTGENVALNVKNKRIDNIDLRIKGIELYLEYYKLVFNIKNRLKNDKASIKLNINNYINNSEIRLDYLKGKKISLWLGNIVNLKYYPSIKSYLGDLLLILKVKILYKRGI